MKRGCWFDCNGLKLSATKIFIIGDGVKAHATAEIIIIGTRN